MPRDRACWARLRPSPFGALDGEASLGPLLAPSHQLSDGAGVDDEASLGELVLALIAELARHERLPTIALVVGAAGLIGGMILGAVIAG